MTHASLGHSLRAALGAGLGAALLWAAPAAGQAAWAAGESVALAPHRAVYELTLSASRGGTNMTSVTGRMVYDLTGSPCEGYTQKMRFVTRMTHQSGSSSVSDLRSTTWEDGVGKSFRFDSTQVRDDNKAGETTTGEATRLGASEGVKVELTKPAKRTLSVPAGAYFPVQHTIALLLAARAGKASFRADLYDGSEKGEKVYDTVAAVGRVQTSGSNRKLAPVAGTDRLNATQAWPVSIAYFEPRSEGRDALPVYEISFLMFDNGVSRRLKIDYGDFALQGDITEITFHEPSKCERK
jgi:envelope integrity protein B